MHPYEYLARGNGVLTCIRIAFVYTTRAFMGGGITLHCPAQPANLEQITSLDLEGSMEERSYWQLIPKDLAKEIAKHTSLTRLHLYHFRDEGNAESVDIMLRSLVNLRTLSFNTMGQGVRIKPQQLPNMESVVLKMTAFPIRICSLSSIKYVSSWFVCMARSQEPDSGCARVAACQEGMTGDEKGSSWLCILAIRESLQGAASAASNLVRRTT